MKFNCKYQVWYDDQSDYTVQPCAHPDSMRPYIGNGNYKPCCAQFSLCGYHIEDVEVGMFDSVLAEDGFKV